MFDSKDLSSHSDTRSKKEKAPEKGTPLTNVQTMAQYNARIKDIRQKDKKEEYTSKDKQLANTKNIGKDRG